MSKPRVLFYLDCPVFGGSDRVITHLLRCPSFAEQWELSVIYRHNPHFTAGLEKALPASIPRTAVHFPERLEWLERCDARFKNWFVRKAVRAVLRVLEYGLFVFETVRLETLFRARRPDLVHINNGGYPGAMGCRAAARAARAAGVRAVLMNAHGQARPLRLPWEALDSRLDRLVDRSTDAFVTASGAAREALIARGVPAGKISRIPNGVPKPAATRDAVAVRKELGLKASDLVWITTAFFEPRKGHAVILEAIKDLTERNALPSNTRFVFVGDGPERTAVEKRAEDWGLSGSLLFLGYRTDALDILNACDGMILPSLHSEDMPLIVLDAMALGKPVIASALPGIAEEVEPEVTGLLIAPGDAGRLAEAVASLSDDPERRSAMGRAGRLRFENDFEVGKTGARYAELYRRLLLS